MKFCDISAFLYITTKILKSYILLVMSSWKEQLDHYIKEFVKYVAKDPKDFFISLLMLITPLLLISGALTYKYVQMLEKEEKSKKKAAKRKMKPRKDD